MNTLTEIANLALVAINKEPIGNLDEPTEGINASSTTQKSAAIINVVLPQTIRFVQSKAQWSCLTRKETLALISAPTTDDPIYIYAYPDGILTEIKLVSGWNYEVSQKTLRTADSSAVLWCVKESLDPSEWNVYLTEAIVDELAARIAPKLAEGMEIAIAQRSKADRTLIDAVNSDYTNRATPRERDHYFGLNEARDGRRSAFDGGGDISRLRRGLTSPRYP